MNRNVYLTNSLKVRYNEDFEKVLNCKREFWKIDDGLKEILSEINSNPYIHTLYSKKASLNNPNNSMHSYLEICFSYKIEMKLFREVIAEMTFDFNRLYESKFYFSFQSPRLNENYLQESEPFGLGCIDDPMYFWINTIHLDLETYSRDIHTVWWEKLRGSFTSIKP